MIILVILLAGEQCFSLCNAFFFIDTVWYEEGLASNLAF